VRTVRLAAVALRLDLDRAESLASFARSVEDVLDGHVVAHADAPTLVAFP
jgi:hypothetical protein